MSFEQLRSFVTVAEEENLTRAAEKLRISQPPLTRKIKSLEDELGTPLFERRRTGVKLLPAGQRLLEHARLILSAVDLAVTEVRRCDKRPVGAMSSTETTTTRPMAHR